MERRESIKLLLMCAFGAERISPPGTSAPQGVAPFASQWHRWPDMRWAGPSFWGNRLQDWAVESGVLICRTAGPNRTLHCLTHRLRPDSFSTSVSLDLTNKPSVRAGFRIGAKGRFNDFRSAAVYGQGLDVGVDTSGALFIGDTTSPSPVVDTFPTWLACTANLSGEHAVVTLTAYSRQGW